MFPCTVYVDFRFRVHVCVYVDLHGYNGVDVGVDVSVNVNVNANIIVCMCVSACFHVNVHTT